MTVLTPRRIIYGFCIGLLLIAALVVPMPFFALTPGSAVEVADLIEIEGHTVTELDGSSALLAVNLRRPSLVELAWARMDAGSEIVPLSHYVPAGQEDEDYFKDQADVFTDTFAIAAAVALRAADLDVVIQSSPKVVGVLPNGPSADVLMAGDLVLRINGTAVQTADELVIEARHLADGDEVSLQVQRGDDVLELSLTAGQAPRMERPGLGISVDTSPHDVILPFDVHLADHVRIGGPSAGLLFSLTVYDLVAQENLLAGRRVTGTGTIDVDGRVGRIGAIRQKVAGAVRDGYQIFLAPRGQAEEAREEAGDRILVIGVDTFAEALEALRDAPLVS